MLNLRKLEVQDNNKLEELIKTIEGSLENEEFWLPITMESREHFFDEEWTYFLGMFDKEKLVAAVALFFNKNEYEESQKKLKLEKYKIAEIGRAMVLPEYRHQRLMKKITNQLITHSKELGIQYLIATVHPKNIPSQVTIENLGLIKKEKCIKQGKYERDIFLMKNDKV